MFDKLVEAFVFDNIPLLVSSAFGFAFSFYLYCQATQLVLRDGKGPWPTWLHSFYFAHDTTWTIRCLIAASHYEWNWFLTATSVALMGFVALETFNLYLAVTVERQEAWGQYYAKSVTAKEAISNVVAEIIVSFCIVNVFTNFMGGECVMEWFAMTVAMVVIAPVGLLRSRRTRDGYSTPLAIGTVILTAYTFSPLSLFVLALRGVFGTTWYYLTGIVFTGVSVWNLAVVVRLPKKKTSLE